MSGRKIISSYTCALCGRENQAPGDELPFGWLKHSVESLYDERSFADKYICDHCMKAIDTQRDFLAGEKLMKSVLGQMPRAVVEQYFKDFVR